MADGQLLRRSGTAVVGDDRVARRISAATAALEGNASNYIIIGSNEGFHAYRNGALLFYCGAAGFGLPLDQEIWWTDSRIGRVAANTVAQHNGASAQTWWLYNTDGGSNFERLSISWASNICTIQPQAGGTGTARPLHVRHIAQTVASLPAAASGNAGVRTMVSDATASTFYSVVSGGGSIVIPVFSDGTNWRIG